MNRLWPALMLIAFAASKSLGVEPCVLIHDGQAGATIVVSKEADSLARRTATDLQKTLSRMTGVALPIRSDAEEVNGNRVLVGRTRWTDMVVSPDERRDLGKEGFILRRLDGDVALASSGPYGVAYAASELLEQLGARWYLPGRLGEVVPRMNRVQFDQLDVRQVPSFAMRRVGTDVDWNLRNRTNQKVDATLPPPFRVETSIYHTQARWVPHLLYDERHPEFFALIGGQRSRDPMCKLCNSNKALPVEIARRMGEFLRSTPGVDLISLSPTDGQQWCECDPCKALDEKGVPDDQKYSRRQMVLYNRVAEALEKEFPGQKMLVGAYNVYTWPPRDSQINAHRNLAVVICHYSPYCLAHPVNDAACERNHRYAELIAAWQKHTRHVFFYEYYWKVDWLDLPWPIVQTVAVDIPYFKKIGVEGLFTQYTPESIWSNFLVQYVAARLLWDHTTDVKALLEEFYVKFYGRAAGPMKTYHEALERQMAESGEHISGYAPRNARYVFTPELLERLTACLDEARAVADDELVKARLERIALSLEYTKRLVSIFGLRDRARAAKDHERTALLQAALDRATSLRDDVLRNRVKYAGVAAGRYFEGRFVFAREIEALERQLRQSAR